MRINQPWRLCVAPILVVAATLFVGYWSPARATTAGSTPVATAAPTPAATATPTPVATAAPTPGSTAHVPTPRVVNSIDFDFGVNVSALAYDPGTGHELAFGNDESFYTVDGRTGKLLSTINPYERPPLDLSHDYARLVVAAPQRIALVGTEMGDVLLLDLHRALPRRWAQLSAGVAPVTVMAVDDARDAAFVGIGPPWSGAKGMTYHPSVVSLKAGTRASVSSVPLRGLDIVTQIAVDGARARVLVVVAHQHGTVVEPRPGSATAYLLDAATMAVVATWTTAYDTAAMAVPADGLFVLQSAHAGEVRDALTGAVRARFTGGGYPVSIIGDRLVSTSDNAVDIRDPRTGALVSHVAIRGSRYGLYDVDVDAARGVVFVQTQDEAGDAVFSFIDVAHGAVTRRLSYVDVNPLLAQYVPSVDRIFLEEETFKDSSGYEHLLTLDPTHIVLRPLPSCGCPHHT